MPIFAAPSASACCFRRVQQFTGINVVMYYAPRIFEEAGFGLHASLWGTAIVGLVNVLATFVAIGVVDRLGRRPVLLIGFAVMAVGLGCFGILLNIGTHDLTMRLIAVAMLLIFIAGFATSAGPLIWILCSEVQPTRGRDFGVSASTFMNWAANFVVGLTFPVAAQRFGHRRHLLALRRAQCSFHCNDIFPRAGDQGCLARDDRSKSDGGQAAAANRGIESRLDREGGGSSLAAADRG